jgi:hypothetical protein
MQRLLLALSLLLALAACRGDREIVWTPVTAADGSFKIEMPGKAELKSASLATPAGPAEQKVYVVQDDEHFYMAGYVEYPAKVSAKVPDRELLDTARDGAVERSRGKLLLDEPKQMNGVAGRRIEVDAEEGSVRVRGDLFVQGRRLYQVFATTKTPDIGSAEVARFLDSFVILPRASTEGTTIEMGKPTVK